MNLLERIELIRNSYPNFIRADAYEEGTVTSAYDEIRAEALLALENNIRDGAKRLVVQTSDLNGIIEWEKFLGIQEDTMKSFEERKGIVLGKLTGKTNTLLALKNTIIQLVGGSSSAVEINELFTDPLTAPGDVFNYEVIIDNALASNRFSAQLLEQVLREIHPIHCNVLVIIIYKLVDAIGMSDSIQTALHSIFTWDFSTWDDGGGNPMNGDFWN